MKHILFPVDFSQQSMLAAPYVRAFARRFHAQVTLMTVVPAVWTAPPAGVGTRAPVEAAGLEIEFRSRLDKVLSQDWDGILADRVVRSGDPAGQITQFAQESGVDLITMPTHGAGVFRNMLIGSVASKVLHDASCAVWLATHAREQQAKVFPRTILCGLDTSPDCMDLMRRAVTFSQECDAELKFIHIIPSVGDWLALPGERALEDRVRKDARERLDAYRSAAGTTAPLRIVIGDLAKSMAEEARQDDADLLLIAKGAAASGRLRAHAYSVIHRSPCPVLVV